VVVLVLFSIATALPVPDGETEVEDFDSDTTLAPKPTKSPRIPKIDEKDLGIPDEEDDDYEDDPDYMTWEDLGRVSQGMRMFHTTHFCCSFSEKTLSR